MKFLTFFFSLFPLLAFAATLDLKHEFKDDKGTAIELVQLNEKGPLLIVNIATRCGLTGQLDDLEKLYQQYKGQGLQVVGIPSNDFAGQTPEGDAEVAEFCRLKYGVSFPIVTKQVIVGEAKHPLYAELLKRTESQGKEVSWNFEKFLIAPKGEGVVRFSPRTLPLSDDLKQAVEKFLKS